MGFDAGYGIGSVKPGVCTSSTRPASPYDGQVIYMTDVDQTAVWDGSAWVVLAPIASDRNVIINGAMQVWQRGTSFTGVSPYYGADRWQMFRSAAVSGATWSRQSASLDGYEYCVRVQRNSGNTSTNAINTTTTFETLNIRRLHGKPLVLSFYARSGANYSPSSGNLRVLIESGTGTDGSLANGFTGSASLVDTNVTLTSSWQRFSVSYAGPLSSSKTQLGIYFQAQVTGTAGANDYFELTGVQLEAGAVATPFEFEDYSETLRKCQRYYARWDGAVNSRFAIAVPYSTTKALPVVDLPVTMRVVPTAVTYLDLQLELPGVAAAAITDVVLNNANTNAGVFEVTSTGLTAWQPRHLQLSSSSGYLAVSAEL